MGLWPKKKQTAKVRISRNKGATFASCGKHFVLVQGQTVRRFKELAESVNKSHAHSKPEHKLRAFCKKA